MIGCNRHLDRDAASRRPRRFFTLAEANSALVLVRRVVADIICDYSRLSDLQEEFEASREACQYGRAERAHQEIMDVVAGVQACAEELDEIGVELTDWMLGIVAFRCLTAGREVTLCWQADQPDIGYWYEADADITSRKLIDTLPVDDVVHAHQR